MIYNNVLETIGNTPLIKINHFDLPNGVNIFVKFEGFNPSGSIKDRIALKMINQAIKSGELTKDKIIIEATSGNTGISLAMIGSVLGYRVTIVMSDAVSVERRKMIKAYGADIILTEGSLGTDGAIKKVKELIKEFPNKYFTTDQFTNKYNKLAHYETTGVEIWKDMNGDIDYFVSAIGTSGTIMGIGKFLKTMNPNVKIVSAHPVKGHYIQGLKNMEEAIVPALYDESEIDKTIMVDTKEAFQTAREVIRREGLFVGMSSGAAMLAALKLSKTISKGNIVVIFPDRGEKYLSTSLFK